MSTLRRNAGVPSSVYGSAPGRQPRDWPSSFPVRIEIDESNELPLTSGLAGIARVTTSRESTVVPIAVLRYVTKDRASLRSSPAKPMREDSGRCQAKSTPPRVGAMCFGSTAPSSSMCPDAP